MNLKRINFKRGGAGGGSGPNNSPGTTQSGGNANTGGGGGPDRGPNEPDRPNSQPDRSRTTPTQDRNNREAVERGRREVQQQKEEEEAIRKEIEDKRIDDIRLDAEKKSPFANLGAWFNKQRQEQINKVARRNKYKTLQNLGQLPKDKLSKTQLAFMAMNPMYGIGKLAFGQTKVDPETDMFDIDSIREIGMQTQYTPTLDPVTGKTTYGTTANQARDLARLKEDINIGNRNDVTQEEFDTYINRNKTNFDSEGGGMSANILPYQLPGEEEVPEDTGPEYRFGDPND
jgi:hypothetical protein